MKAAIDIILLLILAHGAWSGYKKGLLMGIGGIVCLILSMYGANLLANTFSYDVIPALRPFAGGYVEGVATDPKGVLKDMGWDESDYSLDDLLAQAPERREDFAEACYEAMGINSGAAAIMAEAAVDYAEAEEKDMVSAVTYELCSRVSYVGCFTLAFMMIAIILTVIGNLPNLSYKIPHLDLVNDIVGAVLGLGTGFMYCAVIVWVLKFLGMIIGPDTVADTILGGWLLELDLPARFLGI